jgi:Arc/MetJ family transcription regulator
MKDKAKQPGKAMLTKFMLRIDDQFLADVQELRRYYEDMPTKSEAIRRAVRAHVEAIRKGKGGKK